MSSKGSATREMEGRQHACGGTFHLVSEPGDISVRGTPVTVTRRFFRCNGCGAERMTMDQLSRERQEAAAGIRSREQLLTPQEIRALRDRLGLSQTDLERALGLGPKTVVRWESGKVLPNKATNELLVLIDRDPGALAFLAERNGVALPQLANSAKSSCSVVLPRSLFSRLEQLAASEGVDVSVYLAMVLGERTMAIQVSRQYDGIQATLHTMSSSMQEWNLQRGEPDEPEWLRESKVQYGDTVWG